MSENIILLLVAVVVGGGLIAGILYFILRHMRGSIKLSLPQTAFNPGNKISGEFDLLAKKPIQGNKLIVRLIGQQVTRHHQNGKSRTRSQEIYRDEVLVEEAKDYPAGYTGKYSFEINTPNTNETEFLNSPLGQTLNAAVRLLSNRNTRLQWRVEARLDAKGIDLVAAKKITLNTKFMG